MKILKSDNKHFETDFSFLVKNTSVHSNDDSNFVKRHEWLLYK